LLWFQAEPPSFGFGFSPVSNQALFILGRDGREVIHITDTHKAASLVPGTITAFGFRGFFASGPAAFTIVIVVVIAVIVFVVFIIIVIIVVGIITIVVVIIVIVVVIIVIIVIIVVIFVIVTVVIVTAAAVIATAVIAATIAVIIFGDSVDLGKLSLARVKGVGGHNQCQDQQENQCQPESGGEIIEPAVNVFHDVFHNTLPFYDFLNTLLPYG
jgi:hypothetical protein